MTGAPLRQAILDVDRVAGRAAARQRLGIPDDRFLVAVMGGSLGSGRAQRRDPRLSDRITVDDADLAVHQIAGERFAAEHRDRSATVAIGAGVIHRVVGYEPNMPAVYAAADLLDRAGGGEHGARGGGDRDPGDPGAVAGRDR